MKNKDLKQLDLSAIGKTFDEVLDETVKQGMIKPNWKWKLLSITNNKGNKQTQFKMSDFGEPFSFPQATVDVMCDSVNTECVEGAHYGLVHPIPLTEKWLEDFGFQKEKTNKKGVICEYNNLRMCIEMSSSGLFYLHRMNVIIPCVHDLQNLHYAMCRQELTLKK